MGTIQVGDPQVDSLTSASKYTDRYEMIWIFLYGSWSCKKISPLGPRITTKNSGAFHCISQVGSRRSFRSYTLCVVRNLAGKQVSVWIASLMTWMSCLNKSISVALPLWFMFAKSISNPTTLEQAIFFGLRLDLKLLQLMDFDFFCSG